ncbi:MAG: hypothetical protein MR372_08595 [Lachnospiraceae bacterium]|nr:hypothetical protein [Lachnospiraceae bacterium]
MTKRSTLLKVIAILMIIFGAIALFTVIGSVAMMNSMLGSFGMDLGDALALAGYVGGAGVFWFAMILSIIACIIELLAGILGLASKSKGLIVKLGLVTIILQVISLIFAIVVKSFAPMNLISFILPILYFIGAKSCVE